MKFINKYSKVGSAVLVALISTACIFPTAVIKGIIRHDVPIQKYLELGNQTQYDCIGRYSESIESPDYAVGVLIASQWVLTASHFVQDSSVWKFGDRFYHTKEIVNRIHPINPILI